MTPAPENEISITALDRRFLRGKKDPFDKLRASIKKTAVRALKILRKKKISVDIYLAGPALMKKLNAELRNKNYPADVLSFQEPKDFIFPESEYEKIGEIFLNFVGTETKKLLIHGLLHLLGYTHKKEKEAIKMEKMEKMIIGKLK